MGTELFHTDGQTDITKLTVAFRNFTNSPDNYYLNKYIILPVRLLFLSTREAGNIDE
jgi:hypothetical protein